MKVEINNQTAAKLPKKIFDNLLKKAQSFLKLSDHAVVSLALVEKEEIRRLNQQCRHQKKVTDVLSFSALETKNNNFIYKATDQNDFLGEIIICYPMASEQAKKYQHTLRKELSTLFIHGLLHLAGYHHANLKEKKVSNRVARDILS